MHEGWECYDIFRRAYDLDSVCTQRGPIVLCSLMCRLGSGPVMNELWIDTVQYGYWSRPLKSTGQHSRFLTSTGRQGEFLKSTGDMGI